MIRAFLDANVFVSGILSQNGPPGRILKDWFEQRFELATSPALLAELRRVLNNSKVRRRHGWSEAELDEFLENVESLAVIVPGELRLNVITDDPSDDRYLECALEARTRMLQRWPLWLNLTDPIDPDRAANLADGERIVHDWYRDHNGWLEVRERITTDPNDEGRRCERGGCLPDVIEELRRRHSSEP